MSGAYKRSKFLAEAAALEERELPVIAVNPTAPIGDHDPKPTPTGRIVLDFLKGDMPAFIDTGLNLVDVRDVALGHILAAEKGRPRERYILGCENLTLEQILQRLAALTGRKAPTLKLPYAVAYAAGVVTTAWAQVSGNPPRAPLDAVKMAKKKMFVSHEKAGRELGYSPGSVDNAMRRAIDWFQANGYC
jgi:dihydroflavonol-4-reductase